LLPPPKLVCIDIKKSIADKWLPAAAPFLHKVTHLFREGLSFISQVNHPRGGVAADWR
jgi:hypothetical protein